MGEIDVLGDLYRQYGEAMVQLEIIQNRVNEIKLRIIEELKKQNGQGTPPPQAPAANP
jgi:hypothetical protein